jgi:hypothetical protein
LSDTVKVVSSASNPRGGVSSPSSRRVEVVTGITDVIYDWFRSVTLVITSVTDRCLYY